jgi:hypothetical protein
VKATVIAMDMAKNTVSFCSPAIAKNITRQMSSLSSLNAKNSLGRLDKELHLEDFLRRKGDAFAIHQQLVPSFCALQSSPFFLLLSTTIERGE